MHGNMKFELLIGLRYVRARRRTDGGNRFISFISMVSMLGIALGVAALIVVLSVMNGFQRELRTRILGVAAHAEVVSYEGDLADWQAPLAIALHHPGVRAAAPYVQQQGMLADGGNVRGTLVRGILPDEEAKVADIGQHMKVGDMGALKAGEFGIVLGSDLAKALGVIPGQKVMLFAPTGIFTPVGMQPRSKQFTVVGIFEVGMFEFDGGLALIHLQDAQALYRMGSSVSGVRLKLEDMNEAPRIARELMTKLDSSIGVSDWTRSHANFFRAVQIEKNVMFIILSLIVAVAAFNIVSTLVMAVQDKRADIAILRTLGATPASIMVIFMMQGALMGLIGLGLGIAGGVLLALNISTIVPAIEHVLGIQFLAKDVYFISELPSQLLWSDVTTITTVAFVLTLIATLYPSWRASRVNPAEALRYE